MSTNDSYDQANTKIDEQKRALLAAMAQGGMAAKTAYEASQAQLGQQRQASIAAALAAQGKRDGSSPELAAELERTIAAPYDRQIADLGASSASRQADMAQRQAGSEAYLTEAQASIPTLRARSEAQVAALRAKAEQEEADRQFQREQAAQDFEIKRVLGELGLSKAQLGLESDLATGELDLALKQIGLQTAGVNLTAAQARAASAGRSGGGGGDLSDSELRTRLLGAAARAQPKVTADTGNIFKPKPVESVEAWARRIGVESGLDPNRVYGLIRDPKPAAPKKPAAVSKYVRDEHRDSIVARAQQSASKGTVDELFNAIDKVSKANAVAYVNKLSADYLKKRGVSRKSLLGWVNQFYAKG